MSTPDVHIVNVVETEDTEYLADVGYASPFFEPLPLNLTVEYKVTLGNEKYILYPKDENGSSKLEQYRNDELIHGYTVKPKSRSISEFDKVIKASYNNDATFMNSLLIVLFGKNSSRIINNLSYIEVNGSSYSKRKLFDKNELVSEVEKIFHIPEEIVEEVVKEISYFGDAWH